MTIPGTMNLKCRILKNIFNEWSQFIIRYTYLGTAFGKFLQFSVTHISEEKKW